MAFPLPSIAETQILPKKGHQKNASLSRFFQYNYVCLLPEKSFLFWKRVWMKDLPSKKLVLNTKTK
jgi:hypothetical protein